MRGLVVWRGVVVLKERKVLFHKDARRSEATKGPAHAPCNRPIATLNHRTNPWHSALRSWPYAIHMHVSPRANKHKQMHFQQMQSQLEPGPRVLAVEGGVAPAPQT